MKGRVLVTGGAGFIGSHTVDLLLKKGYEVRILDSLQKRVHPHGKPNYIHKNAELFVGDISDRKDLEKSLKDVDYIIHLAAYQDYMPDFSKFIHTNAESMALIFELIVEGNLPIKKIVYASSQSVSGDGKWICNQHGQFWAEPRTIEQLEMGEWEIKCPVCKKRSRNVLMTEEICRPITTYGISKYTSELLALTLGSKYGIPTTGVRYTYVQGPRNSIYNAYSGILRVFSMRILANKPPILFEDGLGLRDYVDVRDVASANLLLLEEKRANNQVYFVGGGKPYTALEYANIMLKVFNSALEPVIPGIFRLGDTRSTVSSIDKIGTLGWTPIIALEKSMADFRNWLIGLGEIEDVSDRAMEEMIKKGVIRRVKK
jgi:dTDP-L-rhamnose 4-epimerase